MINFFYFLTMDTFELTIWKGDWGLPSVDTECLQILVCNLCIGYNIFSLSQNVMEYFNYSYIL